MLHAAARFRASAARPGAGALLRRNFSRCFSAQPAAAPPPAPPRQLASLHMQQLTCASQEAARLHDEAVTSYLTLRGDPVKALRAAVALDPHFVAGHCLLAAFVLLSTGHSGSHGLVRAARGAACEAVRAGRATPREVHLALAVEALAAGRWGLAARVLEHQLSASPTDVVVLRLLHDLYFFAGDATSLRNSVARAFQAWDPAMPAYGHVCGMLAFGLEECGELERAEELAMGALHREATDIWALHAAVHVHETRGQFDEGKRLLKETEEDWAGANLFARHLYWHWGIFSLEEGLSGWRSALSRYDNDVAKEEYTAVTALGDCTSLLWRLEMLKNPLLHASMPNSALPPAPNSAAAAAGAAPASPSDAARWRDLAARWKPYLPAHDLDTSPPTPWWPSAGARAASNSHFSRWYAWNDVHAVMALSMASARGGDAGAGAACEALLGEMAGVAAAARSSAGSGGERLVSASASAAGGDVAWLSATLAALGVGRPAGLFAALGGGGGGGGQRAGSGSGFGSARSGSGGGGGGGGGGFGADAALPSEQARVTALAGLDTALGCAAFARGEWAVAAAHLGAAAPHWPAMGGSHVQRDVFETTLLDALCGSAGGGGGGGSGAAAAAAAAATAGRMLASQRVTLRPHSPQRWWSLGAALSVSGGGFAQGAQGARNRAHALGLNQGPGY